MIKELLKTFCTATVVTLGMLTGNAIWEGGMGEKIKENSSKLFNKKNEDKEEL